MSRAALDLSGLNPAQLTAVTAPPGFHLVVAGAGTGKTRTLVHRVAWLIDRGADPGAIALLTFTRRAAREMLGRAARLVGPGAHRVQGGTFHAYASRALRPYATKIGRSPDFTVMDRADAEDLVGIVREELKVAGRRRRFPSKATLLAVLSRVTNTGEDLETAIHKVAARFADDQEEIARIGAAYAARKTERDLVDYDDLLVMLRDLLRTDATARRELAGRCQHVLVDEYQDTNRLQGHIAALLSTVHGDLMVVGDEAQSIYAFRGATVDNILRFPERFQGARLTLLEENYRSTQPVLDLANGVLASFSGGYGKSLHSARAEGPRPRLVGVADAEQEAAFVVERILALREEGVPLRQQAVLFRSGRQSAVLESALTAANLPFRKFGGLRFMEAAHVKDVLSLLRIVANPRDELGWMRVLPWLPRVGAKTAHAIMQQAVQATPPGLDPAPWADRPFFAALEALADLLGRLRDRPLHEQVEEAVEHVREGLEDRYDDAARRSRDLDLVALLASRHDRLEPFLAEAALDPPEAAEAQADEDEEEWLSLSTIHSAKGLEWDAVFVLQLADGSFPSGFSLDDPASLEEERRLLYVALTRARRELFLLAPRQAAGRAGWSFGPGCMLLDDIPGLEDRVLRVDPALAPEGSAAASQGGDEARLAEVLAWIDD